MRGAWEPKQGQAATADPQSPLGKLHIPLRVSLVSTRLSEKSSKRKKAHSVSLESRCHKGGARPLSQGATVKKRAARRG